MMLSYIQLMAPTVLVEKNMSKETVGTIGNKKKTNYATGWHDRSGVYQRSDWGPCAPAWDGHNRDENFSVLTMEWEP
jgi:hypothetical protein